MNFILIGLPVELEVRGNTFLALRDTTAWCIESTVLGGGVGEDAESDLEVDTAGKRPKQQFGPRQKRRMSLRSRNDTIDNWLTMDDNNFAAAPGERYNDIDAFVDLEDFLVDG